MQTLEGNGVIPGHPTFRPLSRNRKQNPENPKIGKYGRNLKIPGESENPGKIRNYKNMPPNMPPIIYVDMYICMPPINLAHRKNMPRID
jgi:hypothetical protein